MFETPTPGLNINCMEGRICPRCGYERELYIDAKIQVAVNDDGADGRDASYEYDETARTKCPRCQFSGTLEMFEGMQPEFNRTSDRTGLKLVFGNTPNKYEIVKWFTIGREQALFVSTPLRKFIAESTDLVDRMLKLLEKQIAPDATPCPTCGHIHRLCSQCGQRWTQCAEGEPGEAVAWCEECNARHTQ